MKKAGADKLTLKILIHSRHGIEFRSPKMRLPKVTFPSKLKILLLLFPLVFRLETAVAQTSQLLVSGADEQLLENVKAHVTVPSLPCDVQNSRLSRQLPGIRQQVVRAGRALGYYQLRHEIRFVIAGNCWNLHVDLTPGEPVQMVDINVEVQNFEELFSNVLTKLPMEIGDQLNQANYERIKTDLSARAIEKGFFEARFEKSLLLLDLQRNTADVAINFNPGERYRIGAIKVPALEYLSPEFISRYIELSAGDYYSSEALLELRNSLNDSLYFSEVSVAPVLNQAEQNHIPVSVGLKLRPQQSYSAGAGLTTDIGPRLRADYENRYMTRQGHSIEANLGASVVRKNLDVRYRIPWSKPATESVTFSGGFLSESTDSFDSETSKLATAYNFVNRFDWRQSYFVDYQHDDYRLNRESEISDLLMAGISFNRTNADDALYPSRGWRVFAQLRTASKDLLSPETFLQINLAGKLITTLGPGRLLLKGEFGSSDVDDISNLPVSIQHFAGGDQSVRGYKYQSLGPLNENGEITGGKHLLSAGIEYDFSIRPNWKLALFVDGGNAFNSFSDYDLKTSAGVGVRWLSPIGPIRVDLASARDDDNKLRLHITMGPDL